jgi:hypothetical protein
LALERDSVIVEGKVLRLRTNAHRRYGHHVAYEYSAPPELEARTFQGETNRLPKEHFDRLKEGGPIAVTICRTDPANHQVFGEPPRSFASAAALAFSLGILALLGLAGVINLWWWVSRGRDRPAQVLVLDLKSVKVWPREPKEMEHE